ncbi:hypothetical protein [Comamonas sp. JC664]|uniref:hypothetical protein n=1 Tax=Comamonas sp. JC664 TaxID=2801917 RepID=UPI00174C0DDE|nr:hypothetical protein [Comamonas sp. JC664]MBL0694308.1 hypothetical protein [Comamonas sp. JC664]GHG76930.1 hypothetical protein GCM10012319_26400 [Comamonas sp. KCTC 72670]
MRALNLRSLWTGLVLLAAALGARPVHASLYWYAGVQGSTPSVCFVGDALTSRPARVQQVVDYIRDFERVANIRFNVLGTCPAPTVLANGNHWHGGDIRVVIPGTSSAFSGRVPGNGCPMFLDAAGNYTGENNHGGSWSNSPADLATHRGCRHNLKLGDDADALGVPWKDHTLHEFGHALGLRHEHERNDVHFSLCSASGYGGGANSGFITPYDRYSVMHYEFLGCGIHGNYGHAGPSSWDALALHIMYPEPVRVAEFVGRTVIRTTEALNLTSAWGARGANLSFAASAFSWKLSAVTYSTSSGLVTWLGAGTYPLQFSHSDFLGRTYAYSGTVKVLTPADFTKQVVAPVATRLPLL